MWVKFQRHTIQPLIYVPLRQVLSDIWFIYFILVLFTRKKKNPHTNKKTPKQPSRPSFGAYISHNILALFRATYNIIFHTDRNMTNKLYTIYSAIKICLTHEAWWVLHSTCFYVRHGTCNKMGILWPSQHT